MKKAKKLLTIITFILLTCGCGNSESISGGLIEDSNSSNSSEKESKQDSSSIENSFISNSSDNTSSSDPYAPEDIYATINSNNDVVNIFGIVGEKFDLKRIDTSLLYKDKTDFKSNNTDGIEIDNDNIASFKEKGIYMLEGYYNDLLQYKVKILVNENEDSRYDYPYGINFDEYTIQSGDSSKINASENSLIIEADNTQWTRITYDLDDNYSTNYTIDADISFQSVIESTRWFGIIFRDNEGTNKYPYYQFDIRQKTSNSNSIEVTYVYGNNTYSYPYTNSWTGGGPGTIAINSIVHMTLSISGTKVNGFLSNEGYETKFEASLPSISSGNIGFQCSGAKVEIKNLKITLDSSEIVTSNADSKNSLVDITDDFSGTKPHLIATGKSFDDIICLNENCQQFYAVVNGYDLYDINGNNMNETINSMLSYNLGIMIPNFEIEDLDSLKKLITVCKSYGVYDCNIWSKDGSLLDYAKSEMPYARFGYIPTVTEQLDTFEKIAEVCHEAGKHYANMIQVDSNYIVESTCQKATGLCYSIVAKVSSADNYELLHSALMGCKLIIANVTKASIKQAAILYDDSIFETNNDSSKITENTNSLLAIPYVAGHRGAGTDGSNSDPEGSSLPENTIESFEYAFKHGANAIELDIHTTKDNKLAVIHDENTSAYSSKNLVVKNSTLAQLQAIPLKEGSLASYSTDYHIPSLDEVFTYFHKDEYKDKSIIIEIKDLSTKTAIAAIEMAKSMFDGYWYDRITFITFSESNAKEIKEYDPCVQCGYLNTVQRRNNNEYWSSYESYLANGVGLNSQYTNIVNECIQESNARGQLYFLWTFGRGDTSYLQKAIVGGNLGFTTNYVSSFTNNKYRLYFDEEISLEKGKSTSINAKSITYSQNIETEKNIEIIVLSGNATAKGNTLTKTSDGVISIILKEKVVWTLASGVTTNFCIYSDIIQIK